MIRVAKVALLALVVSGCGARTEISTGSSSSDGSLQQSGPPAHIYVSDEWNNRLVRIDDMTGAGWVTWGEPMLGRPCGVVVDAQDRIYFAESSKSVVSRIDDMTGSGYTSLGGFGQPLGVALDGAGRLYVVDSALHRIVRVDDIVTGAGWVTLGGPEPGSGVGQFNEPVGIAVSAEGRILVGDGENHRVVIMDDIDGTGWKERVLDPDGWPYGVSFDREGRLYAADFEHAVVHRWETLDDPGVRFSLPSLELVQMSHVFVHDSDRIFMGMLNGSMDIAAMDDMNGTSFVTFGEKGPGVGQFQDPCGIFAK